MNTKTFANLEERNRYSPPPVGSRWVLFTFKTTTPNTRPVVVLSSSADQVGYRIEGSERRMIATRVEFETDFLPLED